MKPMIVILAAALAACGGATKLTKDEHLDVVMAEMSIATAPCEDFYESNAWSLSGYDADEKALEEAGEAVDLLVDFHREDPDALAYYGDENKTVREVVADAANSLDDCNPDLARRLDREL